MDKDDTEEIAPWDGGLDYMTSKGPCLQGLYPFRLDIPVPSSQNLMRATLPTKPLVCSFAILSL